MDPDESIPLPLREGQAVHATEIETLSDENARQVYARLVSIVHQMARLDAGLGRPTALDDIEVFAASFRAGSTIWINSVIQNCLSNTKHSERAFMPHLQCPISATAVRP